LRARAKNALEQIMFFLDLFSFEIRKESPHLTPVYILILPLQCRILNFVPAALSFIDLTKIPNKPFKFK